MEVLIDARQRVRKSIGSAGLIAIEAYVTVDEEVTDPKLLDGVGTFRAITWSLNAALKAEIFLNWHSCRLEQSIAF